MPDSSQPTIGELIVRLRKEKGWSQVHLAREAGMSPGFLSDIERNYINPKNGPIRPSDDNINSLARALGCSPLHLQAAMGRFSTDESFIDENTFQRATDNVQLRSTINNYRQLDEGTRNAVSRLISDLAGIASSRFITKPVREIEYIRDPMSHAAFDNKRDDAAVEEALDRHAQEVREGRFKPPRKPEGM